MSPLKSSIRLTARFEVWIVAGSVEWIEITWYWAYSSRRCMSKNAIATWLITSEPWPMKGSSSPAVPLNLLGV